MYYCHVQFYLLGHTDAIFEKIRRLTPPEHFDYSFDESESPVPELCARANVIVARVPGAEPEKFVRGLRGSMGENAQMILLADNMLFELPPELLEPVYDIWKTPMTDEEVNYRLACWQRAAKARCAAWETSNFLESVINCAPSLVWFKDKNGIHEKVNDSFCRAVGKTREQVQGRGHAYIWDVEKDDPACIESERIVMESGKTCVGEESIVTGDGERLLNTYKSPLYNIDGSVMGTVGVAMDITKEREFQTELMRQNEVLESLLTSLDCGIIFHTLDDSQIIRINQAALDILGYSSEEEMLRDGFSLVARSAVSEDRERLCKIIKSLKKPGDSAGAEYRVRHSDGRILHIMGNFKLVEEDGRLICQRFLLDCTEQKLREQNERRENQRKYSELLHALSSDYSLVCTFDLDSGNGRVLRRGECGPGILKEMFDGELVFDECISTYINTCVYSPDRPMMRKFFFNGDLIRELENKSTYYLNYRTLCCGNVKYYRLKAVHVGDWTSRNRNVVLGFLNVDEETRSNIKRRKELDDALTQADIAERANRAKSAFLSNMSHDIRTPMNAIVGFTTLALTHLNQTEQVEEYLKKILTSGNHLVGLINDVLDMSRIESGKMHLDEAICHLSGIFHGLRSIVQGDVAAKDQELIIDAVNVYDEDIYCDKLRLNQVLLNLLSNSIKYTGNGGQITMTVTEKPCEKEGFANYEFCVRDTGMGMSEEFVKHIFEPFERERNSTISGIQGTGLGMSITKNIVEMMKGTIDVTSQLGVGTEFVVKLTFRLATESRPVAIPHLKGMSALVVDDDVNTCEFVTYILERIGMRTDWTLAGPEALQLAQQAKEYGPGYDLYLVDWLMPGMNGVEVSRSIRENISDDAPIVVLSAYDWSEIETEARQAGVTAFCGKPLFLSDLRRCLKNVFSAQEPVEDGQTGPEQSLRSGRILLAEDNELNQEIAVTILEEAGFETETADNGRIAVDMLKDAGPGYYDLVLMDVQMPVLGGYDATKEIRALPDTNLANIPIIAMTANAFEEDRREALSYGMNGHISKPIDIDVLFETLDEILK